MVTLFTPTYNRAHLLGRLYDSVLRQTNQNFEWIVIDDGSSDSTRELVKQWKKEDKVSIRYYHQQNAGKATAFNRAVKLAEGDVLCCVDSDDYLTDNAVEIIESHLIDIQDENISGIIALKADLNGQPLSSNFPEELKYESTYALNDKYGIYGEWSQIYKVSVLRKYPYPIVPGEKFITESVLFDRLSTKYKALLVNEAVNFCEYQEDGLTSNIYSGMISNPTGYQIYYMQRIDMAYSVKQRLNYIVRYNTFKLLSNNNDYKYRGKYTLLTNLMYFTGVIGKIYYNRKMGKHETK